MMSKMMSKPKAKMVSRRNTQGVVISMLMIVMMLLSGCQLATVEGSESEQEKDRFVGVLVTTEYLDLFNMDAYLNDHASTVVGHEALVISNEDTAYQNRLYATLTTKSYTNSETGHTSEYQEYVFDGVDGIPYFAATIVPEGAGDDYASSTVGEEVSDGHMSVIDTDEEDAVTLEGAIYFSPTQSGVTVNLNPVYQTPDGRVYTTGGGHGYMFDKYSSEGMNFTQTLEEITKTTENGEEKSVRTTVKISIGVMYSPEKIAILQLDQNSNILSRVEYVPGNLPETIVTEQGTEYIVMETYKHNSEGDLVVQRSLFDQSIQTLDSYYSNEDQVCMKQWTELKWTE